LCALIIRLPNGSKLQRRFYSHDTLSVVFDFIESMGYNMEEQYELVSHFPKRTFDAPTLTLAEAGLFTGTRLIVFVQEKISK